MQSAIDEFGYKKLVEIWNQMQGRGLVNEDEIARQIFKSQGLDQNRFVPQKAPQVTASPEGILPPELAATTSPTELVGQDIASMTTPQINLNN